MNSINNNNRLNINSPKFEFKAKNDSKIESKNDTKNTEQDSYSKGNPGFFISKPVTRESVRLQEPVQLLTQYNKKTVFEKNEMLANLTPGQVKTLSRQLQESGNETESNYALAYGQNQYFKSKKVKLNEVQFLIDNNKPEKALQYLEKNYLIINDFLEKNPNGINELFTSIFNNLKPGEGYELDLSVYGSLFKKIDVSAKGKFSVTKLLDGTFEVKSGLGLGFKAKHKIKPKNTTKKKDEELLITNKMPFNKDPYATGGVGLEYGLGFIQIENDAENILNFLNKDNKAEGYYFDATLSANAKADFHGLINAKVKGELKLTAKVVNDNIQIAFDAQASGSIEALGIGKVSKGAEFRMEMNFSKEDLIQNFNSVEGAILMLTHHPKAFFEKLNGMEKNEDFLKMKIGNKGWNGKSIDSLNSDYRKFKEGEFTVSSKSKSILINKEIGILVGGVSISLAKIKESIFTRNKKYYLKVDSQNFNWQNAAKAIGVNTDELIKSVVKQSPKFKKALNERALDSEGNIINKKEYYSIVNEWLKENGGKKVGNNYTFPDNYNLDITGLVDFCDIDNVPNT